MQEGVNDILLYESPIGLRVNPQCYNLVINIVLPRHGHDFVWDIFLHTYHELNLTEVFIFWHKTTTVLCLKRVAEYRLIETRVLERATPLRDQTPPFSTP